MELASISGSDYHQILHLDLGPSFFKILTWDHHFFFNGSSMIIGTLVLAIRLIAMKLDG